MGGIRQIFCKSPKIVKSLELKGLRFIRVRMNGTFVMMISSRCKMLSATEFNIEGFPDERFMEMVLDVKPHQCTLVPDASNQLTSDHGWDTIGEKVFLTEIIGKLKEKGIRVSLFSDPLEEIVNGAKAVGADRVELYTGPFAEEFYRDKEKAIEPHIRASNVANEIGLGINAGHDLNLDNLSFYKSFVPGLLEVSIGHAIICDAIYLGLENTIKRYLSAIAKS